MIAENVENIRKRIASACIRANSRPDDVTMIAVGKTFSSNEIAQAVAAGALDIGENYVQELREKHEQLHERGIRWHFIGHLQSNKVKYIAPWITCIHSVDSLSLAGEISRQGVLVNRTLDILVEVKTSPEETKFGIDPAEVPEFVQKLTRLQNIRVNGLMTIGPYVSESEASRPAFRLMKELKQTIAQHGIELRHLSMGMTNDFEVAIEEGATMVRVGTAIFGKRVNVP